ncbi:alpha/beta hydrolase [Micromonospora sp. NPDC049559]|uniref:alpha/beta hydrolase n=1 Tax=Micromonospora sp. NPDC049559 TaxID=3155923 RepID=UPI003448A727
MPVPEPPADLGFWPRVRAISGWPEPDEDAVRALAEGWRGAGDRFIRAGGYDVRGLADGWPDAAGTAFQRRAGQHLRMVAVTGSEMMELARRADVFAAEVAAVKSAIVSLIEANLPRYAEISTGPFAPLLQNQFVDQVAAMVTGLVNDGAGRIAGAGGAALGRPPGPPEGAPPGEVRQWWDNLLPEQRAAIERDSPDLVRNLDGIPAEVRDRANRSVLDREIAALEARRDEIAAYEDARSRSAASWHTTASRQAELTEAQQAVDALRSLRNRLAAPVPEGAPRPYLLGLDTADDGRAVVSLGNPDTAHNVATVVPGTSADLGSVGGELDRAERLRRAAGGTDTAVVAWIGYDAPDTLYNAGSESYADNGKAALDRFQDGLRATHVGAPSHNTVVGHSYGTTLVGHAARDESLAVDDLVLVSSPGVGAEHVSELRLDGVPVEQLGSRVHATVPPNDPIKYTNWIGIAPLWWDPALGPDPADPAFGADVFESAPSEADPHGATFEAGNPGLATTGEIIADRR